MNSTIVTIASIALIAVILSIIFVMIMKLTIVYVITNNTVKTFVIFYPTSIRFNVANEYTQSYSLNLDYRSRGFRDAWFFRFSTPLLMIDFTSTKPYATETVLFKEDIYTYNYFTHVRVFVLPFVDFLRSLFNIIKDRMHDSRINITNVATCLLTDTHVQKRGFNITVIKYITCLVDREGELNVYDLGVRSSLVNTNRFVLIVIVRSSLINNLLNGSWLKSTGFRIVKVTEVSANSTYVVRIKHYESVRILHTDSRVVKVKDLIHEIEYECMDNCINLLYVYPIVITNTSFEINSKQFTPPGNVKSREVTKVLDFYTSKTFNINVTKFINVTKDTKLIIVNGGENYVTKITNVSSVGNSNITAVIDIFKIVKKFRIEAIGNVTILQLIPYCSEDICTYSIWINPETRLCFMNFCVKI